MVSVTRASSKVNFSAAASLFWFARALTDHYIYICPSQSGQLHSEFYPQNLRQTPAMIHHLCVCVIEHTALVVMTNWLNRPSGVNHPHACQNHPHRLLHNNKLTWKSKTASGEVTTPINNQQTTFHTLTVHRWAVTLKTIKSLIDFLDGRENVLMCLVHSILCHFVLISTC